MRRTSWVDGRVYAGFVAIAIALAGCGGESRRGTDGAGAREGAGTVTNASKAGWARVPVKRVDLKPGAGSYLLEAQASLPSPGWKVEIRPLPVTTPTAREFEVVGLAPAVLAASSPTVVTASLVVNLDTKVEQVAVYDEDDATLLSLP